jgi:hypothetical protein
MIETVDIVNAFDSISLDRLGKANLMNRNDTKFFFSPGKVASCFKGT